MTPLATELMKDLVTPGMFASDSKTSLFWNLLSKAHFFDVTPVERLVVQQADKFEFEFYDTGRVNSRLAFLPATPLVWIEMILGGDQRLAFLLGAHHSTDDCDVSIMRKHNDKWGFAAPFGKAKLSLVDSGAKPDIEKQIAFLTTFGDRQKLIEIGRPLLIQFIVYSALALINSPRIIGRRQHMPHERLEREKIKSLGLVGNFPLRAWTEIILKVAMPDDQTGEPSTESHLTGDKCLHFCRTHLRWCNGRLEYIPVEGHWRGNPALGMKQSRYRIVDTDS